MAIKAIMDGITYNDVSTITATDGSATKNIALSETGVIDIPTATKNINSNGTYDVMNFANAIVNVSGSDASLANGSFQPSEDTLSKTISTGLSTIHGIIIWIPLNTTSDEVRAVAMILVDITNSFFATIGENNNHTQLWSTPMTNTSSRLRYTINDGDITFTTYDENGSGYFVAEHTYQWVAW